EGLNLPHLRSTISISQNCPKTVPYFKYTKHLSHASISDIWPRGPVIVNANPVSYPFEIAPKTGNQWDPSKPLLKLVTTATPKLDFETTPQYILQILVQDNKGSSASQTILIEITDVNEPPVFTGTLAIQDAEVYIPEDTVANTGIYKVTAKDPDNDVLQNVIMVYFAYISSGNNEFAIDDTGTIFTKTTFDFESATKSYTITVKVEDPKTLSITGTVKVFITNVNDNNPILTCTGNTVAINLDEELPIGTVVASCIATDADLMNDLTFQLEVGNIYFSVDKETGSVIIASRMDIEQAGFKTVQSFAVKTCDKNLKCAAISVTATIKAINDNAPFCDHYLYRYISAEPLAADTTVATLICKDLDKPPNTLTYTPISGPLGPGELFEQVAAAANTIKLTKILDYEEPANAAVGHTYQMMLSVSDSTSPPHTVTTTVIVKLTPINEFAPVFNPATYTFTVPETSGAHYKVGKVTATDADYPENCVTYRITTGDTEVIQRFWIDPSSGTIELITQPDFESVEQYKLTVEATDCNPVSPKTGTAMVTIDIIKENDEKPICTPFTYKAAILDNIAVGTNINGFRLNCKDRDSEDNAMRFEITSGNVNNHFGFDPTRGSNSPKLIIKAPFNFEDKAELQQEYHLVVNIIDDNLKDANAAKPRTGTVLIDITVTRTSTTPPSTTSFERVNYIFLQKMNTYRSNGWYIPLVFTLMAVLFVGLVAWACHLVWKYTGLKECCQRSCKKVPKQKKNLWQKLLKPPPQEITKYDTMFDGEAVDPVTGKRYEYNSKTGARKWKD
uniref:Cadherin domain-containing protein n=1 Tax=Latimeria chalumnae TaxID=7897 RepID=H3A511_LATCH